MRTNSHMPVFLAWVAALFVSFWGGEPCDAATGVCGGVVVQGTDEVVLDRDEAVHRDGLESHVTEGSAPLESSDLILYWVCRATPGPRRLCRRMVDHRRTAQVLLPPALGAGLEATSAGVWPSSRVLLLGGLAVSEGVFVYWEGTVLIFGRGVVLEEA